MDEKPKISNTEWGLVISALAIIDVIQIALDLLFEIGIAVNRFIDIIVGLSFGLYLQLRGQSLADPKRLFGLIGTFIGEEIPDVDVLPFWTLDGLYNFSLSRADKVLGQIPGASNVVKFTPRNQPQSAGTSENSDEDLEKAA